MDFTAPVFHEASGLLKISAARNIRSILVTRPTFQFEISVLNPFFVLNKSDMSVMAETSHVFMSAQPIDWHPFTAFTRSNLDVNTRTADDGYAFSPITYMKMHRDNRIALCIPHS